MMRGLQQETSLQKANPLDERLRAWLTRQSFKTIVYAMQLVADFLQ